MRITHTPYTTLVLEALVAADDFMSMDMLAEKLKTVSRAQIMAALSHLKKHQAADMLESNGTWWFATPGTDTRHYSKSEQPFFTKRPHTRRKK